MGDHILLRLASTVEIAEAVRCTSIDENNAATAAQHEDSTVQSWYVPIKIIININNLNSITNNMEIGQLYLEVLMLRYPLIIDISV